MLGYKLNQKKGINDVLVTFLYLPDSRTENQQGFNVLVAEKLENHRCVIISVH